MMAKMRLLGAYHDGWIELHYHDVSRYRLDLHRSKSGIGRGGHRDWRYDEFRIDDDGHLIHEIQWYGRDDRATWQVHADDVAFTSRHPTRA